ncbi:MAG: H+transporting two-sector ATPase C subunit [Magnetococcales bacterium]|nr:H+transporting two-sector ATPase C subunit [Magnetococcales bacterium]
MAARTRFLMGLTFVITLVAVGATLMLLGMPAMAAPAPATGPLPGGEGAGWGYLAAALATAGSSLGAGYAVAHVATAAIGAIVEKPELLGRMLILVGLAEGIAIYGLIVSILILNRL